MNNKIFLNPAELCCTMKKVYKNFIIGDKNASVFRKLFR